MARKREPINVREEILRRIEKEKMPWTQAHKRLGVTRQTLYSWCGQHSAVPPSPKYAEQIAEFIERPVSDVLEELLQAEAASLLSSGYDVEVKVRRRPQASGSVDPRSGSGRQRLSPPSAFGAIPGYVSWGRGNRSQRPSLCAA